MAPGEGGGVERGGKPRYGQWWCGHKYMAFGSWYVIFLVMVELKLLCFFESRGCQPGVHHAGYGQQVACRDVEALNVALVGGDDGSEEFKIMNNR